MVSLHRAYTSTHLGNTKYYSWNIGTAASAISAAITLISVNLVGTVLAVLQLAAGEYLNYNASVELATFTHDYTYKGLVNGQIYYTANRNITYWRVDNITTGATQWKQKRFNYGFGGSNQDMVRMTAEIYCAAN